MTQRRWNGRGALVVATVLLALGAMACGAVEANRRAAGTMANGSFQPGRPPAAQVGPDAGRSCPRNASLDLVQRDLGPQGKATPQADGRLCAVAESLLGWEDERPPQNVVRFLSSYFGMETPNVRVIIANADTEEARPIADRMRDLLITAAGQMAGPARFGLSTLRVKKGVTRIVLAVAEAAVELQPVPRKLESGSKAQLRGRLVEPYTNAKVSISDAQGRLTAPKASGNEFQAELACGDKPGQIGLEIRGEDAGAERILASFPVGCGADLPTSLAMQGAAGKATDERGLLEQINADRKSAGLSALAWDDAVAKAARALAEQYRDASVKGETLHADIEKLVRDAGVSSSMVLVNPAAAASAAEAQAGFSASPTNRANLLNPDISHAGISIVTAQDKGRSVAYVVELFVKELTKVDPTEALPKLRQAIAAKRKEAGQPALTRDARLDKVAQQYAEALAAGAGKVDKATDDKLIRPLYRSYSRLNVLAGAKGDVAEFANEEGVRSPGKVVGVGLAQGANAVLGQNALYGVILIAERSAQQKAR